MKVQEILEGLLSVFPAADAESWDRVGLSVGDPEAEVSGVACALDPSPATIAAAAEAGCNLLVTHHPAFLDAPTLVAPGPSASLAGQTVWAAASRGVALIALHTNLDRSAVALALPGALTGLPTEGGLDADGYGVVLDARGRSLEEVAQKLSEAYDAPAQVWGDGGRDAGLVAFCSGSLGGVGEQAVARGCSTVAGGELSYHRCLDLVARGAAVILVGHDASELPYAELLAETVEGLSVGVPVTPVHQPLPWHIVDAAVASADALWV